MRRSFLLLATLALAGCSGDDSEEPSKTPTTVVIYGPLAETELTPYPSNRYAVEDMSTPTGIRVNIDATNTADALLGSYPVTLTELNEMDGFSTTGGMVVKLSSPIDPRGLVKLPDADPPITDPVREHPNTRRRFTADSRERGPASRLQTAARTRAVYYECEGRLRTSTNSRWSCTLPCRLPATRYAFVIIDALNPRRYARGRSLEWHGRSALRRSRRAGTMTLSELEAASVRTKVIVGATCSRRPGRTASSRWRRSAALANPRREDWTVQQKQPRALPARRIPPQLAAAGWRGDRRTAPRNAEAENLRYSLVQRRCVEWSAPVVIYGHGLGGDKDGNKPEPRRNRSHGCRGLAIDSPEHAREAGQPRHFQRVCLRASPIPRWSSTSDALGQFR
jgi:hypothetical protein